MDLTKIKNSKPYSAIRRFYYSLKNWDATKVRLKTQRDIRKFKNICKGQPCVVIGNGPSLRIEDLTALHDLRVKTFACNRIHKVFSQTPWRPDYYFMSDNKLMETDHGAPEEGFEKIDCFYPKRHRALVENKKNSHYYLEKPFDYAKEGRFSTDASTGVYPAGSVTTEMLQFAFYMGFSEVYLIGVDFSYNVTQQKDQKTYTYNNEDNYFIKGYLKPGEVADMPNFAANLLSFKAAKDTFEANGRIIKNATRGGKLEVFERIDLDELLCRWKSFRRITKD